uniref:Olfactory receptor 52E6-like n=1 Tax=Acanthochromis polyacanthus TaxID=80966 RepID=A0A3Q1EDI2_9TELE
MNFTPGDRNVTKVWNHRDFVQAVSMNVTVVVLGITINYISAAMICTFTRHDIFKQNPRYILFVHLVLNNMIQLTTSITLFICSYAFGTIVVTVCLLVILPAIITTNNTPLNLAFMAAECCISVCMPLRYDYICTVKRTYIVIGIIWAISSASVLPDVFLMFATEQMEFFHTRVFCIRDTTFRSSYSKSKRDVSYILLLVVVWLSLFYCYFRILFVAKTVNADAKKARNTIVLHGFQLVLCMTVYVQPMLTRVLTYSFPKGTRYIYFFNFIIHQILPRFANPIIYGLRDKHFKKYLKRYLLFLDSFCKNIFVTSH